MKEQSSPVQVHIGSLPEKACTETCPALFLQFFSCRVIVSASHLKGEI
ncbi:hypothetical protein [Oribacterium sinus]|nr:hypothetical protein [Oribacterium sinus]